MPMRAEKVTSRRPAGWGAVVLIGLCVAGGAGLLLMPLGPLSSHMAVHVALMNALAPALAIMGLGRPGLASLYDRASGTLFLASAAQIAALWIAHSPPVIAVSMAHPVGHLFAQAALFAAALWFWLAILAQSGTSRWRAIFALLVTGKLFCLMAALLVFSPRALYPGHAAHLAQAAADPLADQHLAGLLMLVLCPLTYVFAGVLIAERWLRELRQADADTSHPLAAS